MHHRRRTKHQSEHRAAAEDYGLMLELIELLLEEALFLLSITAAMYNQW